MWGGASLLIPIVGEEKEMVRNIVLMMMVMGMCVVVVGGERRCGDFHKREICQS